jgi:prevent-host-death family protein
MGPRRLTFNVAEAKAHLPELIERAAAGEEIVLARSGKPQARLVPLAPATKPARKPGRGKGRFRPLPGFDDPLPKAVLALFTGRRR